MIRLGAGGLDGRSLTPTAMAAAMQTLSKFRRLADSHGVDEIIAAATSAVREADNGGDFIAASSATTASASASSPAPKKRGSFIWPRSTACDVGAQPGRRDRHRRRQHRNHARHRRRTCSHGRSFKLGVIRLTERFVKTDPLARRDERRLVKHIRSEIGALPRPDREARLRARDRHVGHDPQPRRAGARRGGVRRDERAQPCASRDKAIHRLRKRLTETDARQRGCSCPGSIPRRADLAVAGAVLLDTLLGDSAPTTSRSATSRCAKAWCSTTSSATRAHIRKVERYPDVRRRSVIELGERCSYSAEHAQQVARLALAVFDATARRARARRSRARVARIRRAAARHRRRTSATSATTSTRTT